jgi:hypothetical protein
VFHAKPNQCHQFMEARSLALLLARVVRLASKETVSPFKKGYIHENINFKFGKGNSPCCSGHSLRDIY